MSTHETVDEFPFASSSEQRAVLCRCGHTRGNHRWHAIGGKRPCYVETDGVRCACEAFSAKQTVATEDSRISEIKKRAAAFTGIRVGGSPGNHEYVWATFADHLGLFGLPGHSGGALLARDVDFIANAKADIEYLADEIERLRERLDYAWHNHPFSDDEHRENCVVCRGK